MDSLIIKLQDSSQKVLEKIASLRERKGKEKETFELINSALLAGHDFVIDLFWEEAMVYQHIFMSEMAKPEGEINLQRKRKTLTNMERVVRKAEFYINKYNLRQWKSRMHRFLGRVYDYKGEFNKSVKEYKASIPLARLDPDVKKKNFPRQFELEGFLSYSLVMSGKAKEGNSLAEAVFRKYDQTKDGKLLKKNDYFTWAVWKSGIPIRILGGLLAKKVTFDKTKMLKWLKEAEEILTVPKGIKTWGDEKFQFRRDEIEALRRKIAEN